MWHVQDKNNQTLYCQSCFSCFPQKYDYSLLLVWCGDPAVYLECLSISSGRSGLWSDRMTSKPVPKRDEPEPDPSTDDCVLMSPEACVSMSVATLWIRVQPKNPMLQVELWDGQKISWPPRVAIVGYGVKGVGKAGCLVFCFKHLANSFGICLKVLGLFGKLIGHLSFDKLTGQPWGKDPSQISPEVSLGAPAQPPAKESAPWRD